MKKNIVIFDFDGTLSASDSNFEFCRYCMRKRPYLYLNLPIIVFWAIMRYFNKSGVCWREHIRRFITPDMVREYVPSFVKYHKQNRFGWAADMVAQERANGNCVVLISASPDYLIPKLVHDIKFDAILTSQMTHDRPWKYKFLCYGKNKLSAFNAWAKKNKIIPHVVRSYSDNRSDMPIMNIADTPVWINRKTGLRK